MREVIFEFFIVKTHHRTNFLLTQIYSLFSFRCFYIISIPNTCHEIIPNKGKFRKIREFFSLFR